MPANPLSAATRKERQAATPLLSRLLAQAWAKGKRRMRLNTLPNQTDTAMARRLCNPQALATPNPGTPPMPAPQFILQHKQTILLPPRAGGDACGPVCMLAVSSPTRHHRPGQQGTTALNSHPLLPRSPTGTPTHYRSQGTPSPPPCAGLRFMPDHTKAGARCPNCISLEGGARPRITHTRRTKQLRNFHTRHTKQLLLPHPSQHQRRVPRPAAPSSLHSLGPPRSSP